MSNIEIVIDIWKIKWSNSYQANLKRVCANVWDLQKSKADAAAWKVSPGFVFFLQVQKNSHFPGAAARLLLGLEKIVTVYFVQNSVLFKIDNNCQSCRINHCRDIWKKKKNKKCPKISWFLGHRKLGHGLSNWISWFLTTGLNIHKLKKKSDIPPFVR